MDPSLILLLRFQVAARFRRAASRLMAPRRVLLTAAAVGLALLWLGNAVISVILREPLDPGNLRQGLVLGMLAYACWHVLKLVYSRPESGIEWTPVEQGMLCAKPLKRRDLVLYRFLATIMAAALKAVIFTLLMLPDLPLPLAGFVGTLLALLFLDLLRMSFEVLAWGVSDRLYQMLRVGVVTVAAILCLSAVIIATSTPTTGTPFEGELGLLMQVFGAVSQLANTFVGQLAQSPFRAFANVTLAKYFNVVAFAWLVCAAGLAFGAGVMALWLDRHFLQIVHDRRRDEFARLTSIADRSPKQNSELPIRLPNWHGAGALVWRQVVGARRHASSLVLALALPAVLSCLPWLTDSSPTHTMWHVTAGLAFYSFLLLPTALKFDFQRDLERMALLKSLPLRPLVVVAGQLATPVLVASMLQFVVLAATIITQHADPVMAVGAWLLLATLNVIIFGLDNLMFLWFPHRLKQEGLYIFLRTTLVFTAKGLLFTLALAVVVAWAILAPWLARLWGLPGNLMFIAGVWLLLVVAAAALIRLTSTAFCRFDPAGDLPA